MMMFVRREGADVVQELGTQEGEATYWRKQVRGQFQQKNAKGFFLQNLKFQEFKLLEARHLTFGQLLESALQRNGIDPGLAATHCPR